MSNWGIIGDTHFDVRGGDENFLTFQINWLNTKLRAMAARGIKRVVQVGDFMDNRKAVRANVMWRITHEVLPVLDELDLELILLVGNHNIYYRESNRIHNMLWMTANKRVRIVQEAEEIDGVLMLAWINKENLEQQMARVENTKCEFCFGHLALDQMPMYRGVISHGGMSAAPFAKFKKTLTGHYHTVSEMHNILCVGSPFHLTWADYPDGTERGWFEFNPQTGETVLHRNDASETLFAVYHHDPEKPSDAALGLELTQALQGRIVKVVVNDRGDTRRFNKFLELAKAVPVIDFAVVDNTLNQTPEGGAPVVDVTAIKTNTDVLQAVVNFSTTKAASDRVKGLIPTLAAELYARVQK